MTNRDADVERDKQSSALQPASDANKAEEEAEAARERVWRLLPRAAREPMLRFILLHMSPLLRSQVEGTDLLQDVDLAAIEHAGGFKGTTLSDLERWLMGIARLTLASQNRRLRRKQRAAEVVDITVLSSCDLPLSRLPSGEEDSIRREVRELLLKTMVSLPPNQQEVLRERFFEDRGVDEVAVRLGITREQVWSRQSRALQALREQMGSEIVPPPQSLSRG